MELVDKLDNKRQFLHKVSDRHEKLSGEYRQSVHTWIVNDKGEFLIQKRSPNKKYHPNLWSQTGGGVDSGETSLQGALRECKEELGIDINKDNIELILSFKRKFDFVDVWLIRQNIDIDDIVLQVEEVTDVKWVSLEELKEMLNNNEVAPSINIYFDMFINLLDYPY